jgi:hypothetical protein
MFPRLRVAVLYEQNGDGAPVFNDLLLSAKRVPMRFGTSSQSIANALQTAATQNGIILAALSEERPVLLVFLRHFG